MKLRLLSWKIPKSFIELVLQIIAFEHTLGHYHAVSLKTGENLLKRKESGEVVFFEALKSIGEGYAGKGGPINFLQENGKN